jgi:WD40 repeat protein
MDHTIRLWDVGDPEFPLLLTTLSGHTSDVGAVAFSSDGTVLASGSFDKTIRLWNLERTLPFATDDGKVRQSARKLLRDFEKDGRNSDSFQTLLRRSREHADLLDGNPDSLQKYPMRKPGENPITWMLREGSE